MKYRFAPRQDYSDFASGKVFLSWPGRPAFPVRLASEMFQRCLALHRAEGVTSLVTLYDPCCGGGYLLSVLAYLNGEAIGQLIGSDIDPEAVRLAERNLSLLTPAGLDQRISEIEAMRSRYGKASHAEALASATRLKKRLKELGCSRTITTTIFQADATNKIDLAANLSGLKVDVVIADVPHGQRSFWQSSDAGTGDPMWEMLEALLGLLSERAILALAAAKGQKISHPGYQRLERLRVGKRQIVFLRPL